MLIKFSKQIIGAYNKFVIKHPLAGMALTSGAGMSIGNLICQGMMYNKTKKINMYQVVQYGAFGLLVSVIIQIL